MTWMRFLAPTASSSGPGFEIALVTSRYQNYQAIEASGLLPVGTSRGRPRWKLPYRLHAIITPLAPSRDTFSIEDEMEFDVAYRAQLDATGIEAIRDHLEQVNESGGHRGLVLLCFEDTSELGEFSCHRRTFARWWQEQSGQEVPELPNPVDACPKALRRRNI